MGIRVGLIDLGVSGRPIALGLLRSGEPLSVFAPADGAIAPLCAAGAVACRSAAEVASRAEVSFVIASQAADVERLLLGPEGVLAGAAPGDVVVDLSTISPEATRTIADSLARHRVEMLDAPLSEDASGAADGAPSLLVGGKPAVFERILPLLGRIAGRAVHVGPNGAGQQAKILSRLVTALTIEAVAEAFLFAKRSGVDPARVRAALLGGFAGGPILAQHGKRMLEHDYSPRVSARELRRDLNLAIAEAERIGIALPGAALVAQQLNALVGSGDGELDAAALVRAIERLNRCSPQP